MRLAALVAFLPLVLPAAARAQERFEPIPLHGNLNDILKRLLLQGDEEHGLAQLLQRIQNDPQFAQNVPELLKKLDPDNPWLRPHLRELADKMQAGGALTPGDLSKLQEQLKLNERMLQGLKGRLPDGNPRNGDAFLDVPDLSGKPFEGLPRDAQAMDPDRLARWLRDFLQDVDDTRVGDFLRESPAWQRALGRLDQSLRLPSGNLDWLGKLSEGWRLPQGWTPQLGNWSPGPLPVSLPRWRFSPPQLGGFNLGFRGGPSFGGGPSVGGQINDTLVWALVPLLLVLLGWFFYRQLGRTPGSLESARTLGPWPVDPARIATRAELIQAFEYLARLRLGDDVLSWNHHAVARRLGTETATGAAGELAQLYELARYTAGDEPLTPPAQTAARRCVAALR